MDFDYISENGNKRHWCTADNIGDVIAEFEGMGYDKVRDLDGDGVEMAKGGPIDGSYVAIWTDRQGRIVSENY